MQRPIRTLCASVLVALMLIAPTIVSADEPSHGEAKPVDPAHAALERECVTFLRDTIRECAATGDYDGVIDRRFSEWPEFEGAQEQLNMGRPESLVGWRLLDERVRRIQLKVLLIVFVRGATFHDPAFFGADRVVVGRDADVTNDARDSDMAPEDGIENKADDADSAVKAPDPCGSEGLTKAAEALDTAEDDAAWLKALDEVELQLTKAADETPRLDVRDAAQVARFDRTLDAWLGAPSLDITEPGDDEPGLREPLLGLDVDDVFVTFVKRGGALSINAFFAMQ